MTTVLIGVGPGVGGAGVIGSPTKPVGVTVGRPGGFVETFRSDFSDGKKINTNAPKMTSVDIARFMLCV